jgi:hypothetical protein
MSPPTVEATRLTRGSTLGYAVGAAGMAGFGTVPGLLLAIYLTNTLGVAAGIAAVVVLVPKLWDVFFLPLVGNLSDRSVVRTGSRARFLVIGAIAMLICFPLTFAVPAGIGTTVAAIWVFIAFLIAASAFAIFQVPYIALAAEITDSPRERTTLMSWRVGFQVSGVLLFGVGAPVLVGVFPAATTGFTPSGWEAWQRDYRAWIEGLITGVADRAAAADALFAAYGLVTRFTVILDAATAEAWDVRKGELPEDLSDEEKIALETGLAQGLRLQLLAGVEHATRDAALPRILEGDTETARALPAAVAALEHAVGLLRLNLKAEAALEHFFLASLRHWARR